MNHDTGAIARFETEQDARAAGYTQPLTDEQVNLLTPMNRQQRRAWAAQQRRSKNHEKLMDQKPSVGRIVHYQAYGTPGGEYKSVPRAAVVTEVHSEECVSLCILNPTGQFFTQSVNYSSEPKPGHWNWPPRA